MVQTIVRCHVPLLKNVKTFAFLGNMTKGITVFYDPVFSCKLIIKFTRKSMPEYFYNSR